MTIIRLVSRKKHLSACGQTNQRFLIYYIILKGKYANLWQFISTKTFSQIEKVNFSSLQKMERKLISSPCKTSVMKLFISLFVKLFQLALFTGFLGYMVFNHANAAQFFRFPVGGHFDVGKVLFVNLFAFVVSKLAVMMAVSLDRKSVV